MPIMSEEKLCAETEHIIKGVGSIVVGPVCDHEANLFIVCKLVPSSAAIYATNGSFVVNRFAYISLVEFAAILRLFVYLEPQGVLL